MVALHYGAHYLVENPLSSIVSLKHLEALQRVCEVWWHPRLRCFLDARVSHSTMTWLGMFGARTPKPVTLVASDQFVLKLRRTHRLKLSGMRAGSW